MAQGLIHYTPAAQVFEMTRAVSRDEALTKRDQIRHVIGRPNHVLVHVAENPDPPRYDYDSRWLVVVFVGDGGPPSEVEVALLREAEELALL